MSKNILQFALDFEVFLLSMESRLASFLFACLLVYFQYCNDVKPLFSCLHCFRREITLIFVPLYLVWSFLLLLLIVFFLSVFLVAEWLQRFYQKFKIVAFKYSHVYIKYLYRISLFLSSFDYHVLYNSFLHFLCLVLLILHCLQF